MKCLLVHVHKMAEKRKVERESQLDEKQVRLAIPALMKHVTEQKGKQLRLLNESAIIWLILGLKKIPQPDKKPRKLPIKHSLHTGDVEVCLISKDESTKVKDLLKSRNVTSVNKVISLTKLRKNYKSYEAKRQLCALYDVFICDDRIYHLLPKLLGKAFFAKKKFPVPVDLRKTNSAGEIRKILQSTYVSLGHGPCSAVKVAHTGQTVDQAVENVMSAVSGIAKTTPRGWKNIQSLNLKTSESISLPIYTSLPDKSSEIPSEPPTKKRKKTAEKFGKTDV